jgi:ankyrin repeat protein
LGVVPANAQDISTIADTTAPSPVKNDVQPAKNVERPNGDLSFVQIQLESHGRRSGDGPFTMTITGEGTVIYIPSRFDGGWILGPQTYHIPPQQVAAMLNLAEKADFWSLSNVYRPAPMPEDARFPGMNEALDDVYRDVEVSTENRVKNLRIYDSGSLNGVPAAADELIYKLAELARRDLWRSFTRETTAQLEQNGFDFRSKRGGELLIEMTVSSANSDADIETLLALGAPADYIVTNHFLLDTALLDAAIQSDRTVFVDKLIAGGALLTEGKTDPIKSARALAHAAANISPTMVAKLLSDHPPLVFHAKKGSDGLTKTNDIPVITVVGQESPPSFWDNESSPNIDDLIKVTQQLLDAGAGINDRGSTGWSLLDNIVHQGNIPFASWLIAHHAEVTETTFTPMLSDEMTVMLLNTQPKLDTAVWEQVKANAGPNTQAWLKAHGKS